MGSGTLILFTKNCTVKSINAIQEGLENKNALSGGFSPLLLDNRLNYLVQGNKALNGLSGLLKSIGININLDNEIKKIYLNNVKK